MPEQQTQRSEDSEDQMRKAKTAQEEASKKLGPYQKRIAGIPKKGDEASIRLLMRDISRFTREMGQNQDRFLSGAYKDAYTADKKGFREREKIEAFRGTDIVNMIGYLQNPDKLVAILAGENGERESWLAQEALGYLDWKSFQETEMASKETTQ